jgi:dienelactone hydrolase
MLYLVPALHALGLPVMLVSYRNDPGAGRGSHGFTEFGQTEWHDVEADVTYARAHGAKAFVLAGASMGGSVAAEYLRHGSQASLVRAAVLDAPSLDLRSDMHYGARAHGIHGPLNWAVINAGQVVMHLRAGLNLDDLDHLAHAGDFHVPILIFHGEADTTVWIGHSRQLAKERPDIVTLASFPTRCSRTASRTSAGATNGDACSADPPARRATASRTVAPMATVEAPSGPGVRSPMSRPRRPSCTERRPEGGSPDHRDTSPGRLVASSRTTGAGASGAARRSPASGPSR